MIRDTVNDAYDGRELQWDQHHLMHCLEYLLQNVMCYADETLLYVGRVNANVHADHPMGGLGSRRMCRDWNKLQAWAAERSACYEPYSGDDPNVSEIDRYKFCPDGSKPWEKVENA